MYTNIKNKKTHFRQKGGDQENIKNLYTAFKQNQVLNKNVIIVGGGPVGLITGIIFILEGYNVLILEATKEYTRDYIFFIQNSPQYSSILDLPKEILAILKTIGCFIGPPPSTKLGKCFHSYAPDIENQTLLDKDMYCDNEFGYKSEDNEDKGTILDLEYAPRPICLSTQVKVLEQSLLDLFRANGGICIRPINISKFVINVIHTDNDKYNITISNGSERLCTLKNDSYDILISAEGTRSNIKRHIINPNTISVIRKKDLDYRIEEKIKRGRDIKDASSYGFIMHIGKADEDNWKTRVSNRINSKQDGLLDGRDDKYDAKRATGEWYNALDVNCATKNRYNSEDCRLDKESESETILDNLFYSDSFLRYLNYPNITGDINYYDTNAGTKRGQVEASTFPQHKYRFFVPRVKNNIPLNNGSNTWYATSVIPYKVYKYYTKDSLQNITIDKLFKFKDRADWDKEPLFVTIFSILLFYNIIEYMKKTDTAWERLKNKITENGSTQQPELFIAALEKQLDKCMLKPMPLPQLEKELKLKQQQKKSKREGEDIPTDKDLLDIYKIRNMNVLVRALFREKQRRKAGSKPSTQLKNIQELIDEVKDIIQISTFTLFPVHLSYVDKTALYDTKYNKLVFLTGDSALGGHYFTGSVLNAGIKTALSALNSCNAIVADKNNSDEIIRFHNFNTIKLLRANVYNAFQSILIFNQCVPKINTENETDEDNTDEDETVINCIVNGKEWEKRKQKAKDNEEEVPQLTYEHNDIKNNVYNSYLEDMDEKEYGDLGKISGRYGAFMEHLYTYYLTKETDQKINNIQAQFVASELFYLKPLDRSNWGLDGTGTDDLKIKPKLLTWSRELRDKKIFNKWTQKYKSCDVESISSNDCKELFYCDYKSGKCAFHNQFKDRIDNEHLDINIYELMNINSTKQNINETCRQIDGEDKCNNTNGCAIFLKNNKKTCIGVDEICMNRVKTELTESDTDADTITEGNSLTDSSTDSSTDSNCTNLSQSDCESNVNCKYFKINDTESKCKKFVKIANKRLRGTKKVEFHVSPENHCYKYTWADCVNHNKPFYAQYESENGEVKHEKQICCRSKRKSTGNYKKRAICAMKKKT